MALALLELDALEDDVAAFTVELGENAWFLYVIGGDEEERMQGIPVIAEQSFESELHGPLPAHRRGRTTLEVPLRLFDREHRCIQLMSFRTDTQAGPALSDILRLPVIRRPNGNGARPGQDMLVSPESPRRRAPTATSRRTRSAARQVPFYLVEASSQKQYTSAFFLDTLMGMLPTLLNAAGPMIGNLFGGLFGGGGKGAGGATATGPGSPAGIASAVSDFLKSPEFMKMITQLVAPAPASPGTSATAGEKSLRRSRARSATRDARRNRQPLVQAQIVDGGVVTGPMIAALIGQLMPLLEKVLTPETVSTLLTSGTPQNLNKIGMDWAKFLADPFAAQAERLWKNTPQVGPSNLPMLLATMESMPPSPVPDYRGVPEVSLGIGDLAPIVLNGSPRVVYGAGRDVRLALSLDTPRRIGKAELHWVIKHNDTGEVFAHGTRPYEGLEQGAMEPLEIAAGALDDIPLREPCLLCVHLVWRSKSGAALGTSRAQLCWFAGEYLYDRVEDSGELIPLNDVNVHRDFWHRIWEGTPKGKTPRVDVECKYYYALETRPSNTPLTTQRRRGSRDPVRLRSGMILSLASLAALRPSLGATVPLDAEQLAALETADFRHRVAQAGLTQVTLRTRESERAALWVYPEMKLQRVILQRVRDVAADGQVAGVEETAIDFPVPALIHVIGARTQS